MRNLLGTGLVVRTPDRKQGDCLGRPGLRPLISSCSSESHVMQLELFCAEETVRSHEQRIASHVQRERLSGLLDVPRCQGQGRRPAARQISLDAFIQEARQRLAHFWCAAMPRRWSSCSALS